MSDELEPEKIAQPDAKEIVDDRLYSSQDVARIFKVSTKTVTRWAKPGGEFEQRNVQVITTVGGQRRYFAEEIHQLFQLMLEGKLYDDDDTGKRLKTASPSRIAGLPKPPPRDPRFE